MSKSTSQRPSVLLYLQLLGRTWYAVIPVPNHLRMRLKSPSFRRTLRTSDLPIARQRRWDVLELAREIFTREEAKMNASPSGKAEAERASRMPYSEFKTRLRNEIGPAVVVNAFTGEEMPNPDLETLVDEVEEKAGGFAPEAGAALRDHVAGTPSIDEVLADYLAKNPKRSKTTAANFDKAARLWSEWRPGGGLRGVTRSDAVQWLDEVSEGKARDTIKRYASVLRQLWNWVHRLDEAPPMNPFDDAVKRLGSKGEPTNSFGFYEPDELRRAFDAVSADEELRRVFLISIYTGFRLSECLQARREVLYGVECFVLTVGKTGNAARVVPVHPILKDIEPPTGVDAATLSVRYGRMMRAIDMPRGKTFHSLRKAFGTALERADCPPAIGSRIMGHRPLGLTYRIYSQGRSAEELRGWVEKVTHPVP